MGMRLQSVTVSLPIPATMAEPVVSFSLVPTGSDTTLTGLVKIDQSLIDNVVSAVQALQRAIYRA